MVRRSPWPRLALFAFMIVVALIQLFPLIWLVDYSLLKSGDFFGKNFLVWPDPPQWANYKNAFTYGRVPLFFFNSLLVTVITVAASAVLALMMGYAFTRMKWKLSGFFLGFVMLGMIIPIHATLLPNFILFHKLDMLNNLFTLILPYTAIVIPISMFIMTGFLETIPRAIEESAVMDGAGIFGVIFKIIFPITKPAIATICVLNFISTWNEFIMANTFLTSEDIKTIPFSIMKFAGEYSSNYGAQFAVMTIIALPTILIYLLFTEQMTKGITAGAVKG
ncbi:sugar ABC transporter permease [Paenibacillus glucanolyticus]|uniref:Sugar ABC transporter permease n=1 Tax=Paenibacillus glucanolyticus TaxID=59843 RepID=A0A163MJ23_9BACL|nr:sugar ABC transporter permease [Paenibacillus glucanolyticus]AWP30974.1 sugar ABC transporter permease [Paenibacillus sp. Cedars]KZS49112.1 sugar ABC transporter permease [Paenibacillus glucanolyticus]OMF72270.1 sugar ABC transporter permease [Paenibacillus glucanolyticus]